MKKIILSFCFFVLLNCFNYTNNNLAYGMKVKITPGGIIQGVDSAYGILKSVSKTSQNAQVLNNKASSAIKENPIASCVEYSPINFFGGFNYDAYFIDVLKYFSGISSVKSIEVSAFFVNPYLTYSTSRTVKKNYKGNITNNIFNDLIAANQSYFNSITYTANFYDSSKVKAIGLAEMTFKIDNVVIENIPFVVEIKVLPRIEYYFYNKNKNVKLYNGILLPYYEIASMTFTSKYSENKIAENHKQALYQLYNNKYRCNQYSKGDFRDGNMEVAYNDQVPIKIEYLNLREGRFRKKYLEAENKFKEQQYSKQNQNDKI